jgi:hypothetical protein
VVTLSSSDTEEALELLFPGPDHDPVSRVSEPSSCSDNDLFEDWSEANDMATNVYFALTTDASSSRTSTANAHVVIESLTLIARRRSNLAHGRRHCEGPTSGGLGMLVLYTGGLRG